MDVRSGQALIQIVRLGYRYKKDLRRYAAKILFLTKVGRTFYFLLFIFVRSYFLFKNVSLGRRRRIYAVISRVSATS